MPEKRPNTDVWSLICIEGYCFIDIHYDLVKDKTRRYYDLEMKLVDEEPNPYYEPDAKPEEPPSWCPGTPCFECLYKECKHFAYAEYGPEEEEEDDTSTD